MRFLCCQSKGTIIHRLPFIPLLFFYCVSLAQPPTVNITGNNCPGSLLTLTSSIQPARIDWTLNGSPLRTYNCGWQPNGISVAGGRRYFGIDAADDIFSADFTTYGIQKWIPGVATPVPAAFGNGPGNAANQLGDFDGICVDASGNIYVADIQNFRVEKWAPGATSGVTVAGGNGVGPALNQLSSIYIVQVDAAGNVYVDDGGNNRVTKWPPGATAGIVVAGGNGYGNAANQLASPEAMYVDPAGNIFVLDSGNGRVVKWTPGATTGIVLNASYNFSDSPEGIYVDVLGDIYLPLEGKSIVVEWVPGATSPFTIVGDPNFTIGHAANDLLDPWSVFIDKSGNMFVADAGNYRVQKFLPLIADTLTALLPGQYSATVTTFEGQTATAVFTIDPLSSVSIQSINGTDICSGIQANFTASPVNGGTTPDYQWQINGVNTGTHGAAYSSNSLNNQDKLICLLTPSSGCTQTTTSNEIIMTVNPVLAPSINIQASSVSVCKDAPVNFNSSAINAGSSPDYQWQVNNVSTGTNSPEFQSSSLNDGDFVTCILTSHYACPLIPTVNSNTVVIQVSTSLAPSIAITANSESICRGAPAIFTASANNGGSSPIYQWQINGISTGVNSPNYSVNSLSNGDAIRCVLTSDLACASNTGTSSNSIIMTVSPVVVPSVDLGASPVKVCSGSPVTVMAKVENGGAAPTYQWQLNGINSSTNSSTFNIPNPLDGDKISCLITSSEACVSDPHAASNIVNLSVLPNLVPALTISSSSLVVCSGNPATFAANPENGGSTPTYQWQVNGIDVGTNVPLFTSSTLLDGDQVVCVMTSDAACTIQPSALSNKLSVSVKAFIPASVEISSSANNICSDSVVSFTANPTNGGPSPSFQWQLNGSNVGFNSSTYKNGRLADMDLVSCIMTSSLGCTSPVTSDLIKMIVRTLPVISLSASQTSINYGGKTQLKASGTNIVTYNWTPSESLSDPSIADPIAAPLSNTLYQLKVQSADGCEAEAGIDITVYRILKMPGAFTPNGDGKNDVFRIPPGVNIVLSDFLVFDRWGKKVFETKNSDDGWDGTCNGRSCPAGTYVYSIAGVSGTGRILLTGTIMLIR